MSTQSEAPPDNLLGKRAGRRRNAGEGSPGATTGETRMDDVPVGELLLGVVGMLVWAVLCGLPALAIYSMAARPHSSGMSWVALVVILLIWLPLVTVLCLWAVSKLIGWRLA
jgi:hypothetical protein